MSSKNQAENQEYGSIYLNPEDLQTYLWASLSQRAHKTEPSTQLFRQAISWYTELYSKGWDRLPFFVVYDLGYLLLESSKFQFRTNQDLILTESNSVSYQNRVINRFATLPIFSELHDIVVEAPTNKPYIVAILACWLSPIKKCSLESLQTSTQVLRQLTSPALSIEQSVSNIESLLETSNYFSEQLEEIVEIFSSVHLGNLIPPEELFIVKNIECLSNPALRIAAKQIGWLEQQMGDVDHPPVHMRKESPQSHVNLSDTGLYPQGGLDQLANRGSIENLVRTELAYVDESADIDMFTMRYLEGELLYYTRDEAQLLRRNRTTHISLEFGHAHHIQYPNQPAQLSLMLRAMTSRLIDDLFKLFINDSMKVILHIHDLRSSDAVELWKIRFKDQLSRGEMELRVVQKPPFADFPNKGNKELQDETEKYIDVGRYSTLIRISPLEPLTNEEVNLVNRQGLNILHLQCPYSPPKSAKKDTVSQPKNYIGVRLTPTILDTLHSARKYLLWTLLGC